MPSQQCPEHRVLKVIVREPGTMLDDIVVECPELTWNSAVAQSKPDQLPIGSTNAERKL
jgi:hypothetical protein